MKIKGALKALRAKLALSPPADPIKMVWEKEWIKLNGSGGRLVIYTRQTLYMYRSIY